MYKALVIGCGNIGAFYDFSSDYIQTHVKAFYLDSRFQFSIYDVDKYVLELISTKYGCKTIDSIDEITLSKFDVVSICTPTDTHGEILKIAVDAKVKVIICEKPISNDLDGLKKAKKIYREGKSKILVNYIRRFQPAFLNLRDVVRVLMLKEELKNISIRYQRGFLNNCSHAFDTIEFLSDLKMELAKIQKHNLVYDHFKKDPTISLQAYLGNVNVSILGLSNVCFSHFEIDLYFKYCKICIKDAGQTIEVYKADKVDQFPKPLYLHSVQKECLINYMENVINQAYCLLREKEQKDNFMQSIAMNQRMLNYLNM